MEKRRSFGVAFRPLEFSLTSVDLTTVIASHKSCTVSKVPSIHATSHTGGTPQRPLTDAETAVQAALLKHACSVKWLHEHATMAPLDLSLEAANLVACASGETYGRIPHLLAVCPDSDGTRGLKAIAIDFFRAAPLHKLFYQFPKGLEERFIASVAWQLTEVIEHVHENGFVYRDLKLPNVLIGQDGLIRLVDFADAERVSRCDRPAGTRHVRAPEMFARGQPLSPEPHPYGPSVDAFALGVVLFELATGTPALGSFERAMGMEAAAANAISIDQDLRYPPHVSQELRSLIASLLAVDPAQRLGCRPMNTNNSSEAGHLPASGGTNGSEASNSHNTPHFGGGAGPAYEVMWSEVREHPFFAAMGFDAGELTSGSVEDDDVNSIRQRETALFAAAVGQYQEEIDMQLLGL